MAENLFPPDWAKFCDEEFPIHKAAREGRIDILQQYVSFGSNINILNHDRESPLHEACVNGHVECVNYLLDNFALIDARTIDNSTPLCLACAMGHENCVKVLLERGALVNPAFVLCTPLHEAVLRHNVKCATLLIKAGAKLEVSDCDMGKPLHAACFRNSFNCCKLLLHAGASVNSVKIHRTALHIAASNGFVEIAMLLLQFGANIYLKDSFGRVAKDLAPVGSKLAEILSQWEEIPPSLKHICRLKIHEAVKPRNLQVIRDLPIPRSMITFVLCEPVRVCPSSVSFNNF